MIRIKGFLVVLASVAALAGCGGGDGGSEDEPSGETRAEGTSEVPADPQQVAALDNSATDAMLALGEDPAGVTTFSGTDFESYEYVEEDLEGVELLGQFVEPDLERIAALEPDLIVGSASYMESIYEELSQIAPAVAVNEFGDDGGWMTALAQVGEVLGKREMAEQVIAEFDERVAGVREELRDSVETVSVVSVFPDTIRIWRPEVSETEILQELGTKVVPEAGEFEGSTADLNRSDRIYISRELLPRIDGQALVLRQTLQDEEAGQALEDLRNSPLWQELPAVKNDLVLVTDSLIFTGGVFGYRNLLEEYAEFLGGTAEPGGES